MITQWSQVLAFSDYLLTLSGSTLATDFFDYGLQSQIYLNSLDVVYPFGKFLLQSYPTVLLLCLFFAWWMLLFAYASRRISKI